MGKTVVGADGVVYGVRVFVCSCVCVRRGRGCDDMMLVETKDSRFFFLLRVHRCVYFLKKDVFKKYCFFFKKGKHIQYYGRIG